MDFEVLLTKDFLKKSYFRRTFRNWWKLAIAFILISFAILLDSMSGGLGNLSVIGLTLMSLCILIYATLWYKQLKFINEFIARQGDTPVRYKLTDEAVEAESVVGESKLRWDAFQRLRIRDLETRLEFSSTGALTLPTNQLNNDILEFLRDRFSAHGKKVFIAREKAE